MSSTRLRQGFRTDVQAVRALAICLVALFHADLGLPGGYVGLDVFFVLSGLLITGMLVDRHEATGRLGFRRFYARRIWRLLPASALVLVTTVLGSWLVMDPLTAREAARDAGWASVQAANLRFILDGLDYFRSARDASPVLHYWSLSVEEQFYAVWPLLLASGLAVRHRGQRLRGHLGPLLLLSAVAATSFLHAVTLVDDLGHVAYYSPLTRAWEFAAGGLLALGVRHWQIDRQPPRWLAWIGLVLVVWPALTYDAATPVPGLPAPPVVLGTGLLLLPGSFTGPEPMAVVTRSRPVQRLGAISYSLYLWHWPLLVWLGIAVTDAPVLARVGVLAIAALLANSTFAAVEDPLRRRGPAILRSLESVAGGLATSVLLLALVAASLVVTSGFGDRPATAAAQAPGGLQELREVLVEAVEISGPVPGNLRPALEEADQALPVIYRDGCHGGGVARRLLRDVPVRNGGRAASRPAG